ncbi:hypothetical protein [Blueberry necrotic ring blotch virus]|uniref:Uncharacterized protein n=1 Tax=Blueberry necrotic ring blotch virus TaxID=1094249 RepID=G5DFD1_9VIRU|nr:hypothetical protein [Blueberry necrotic ring blotch virus]AEQ55304.1 hypothetical protein [Blueberry necrotic ring blotch virus]
MHAYISTRTFKYYQVVRCRPLWRGSVLWVQKQRHICFGTPHWYRFGHFLTHSVLCERHHQKLNDFGIYKMTVQADLVKYIALQLVVTSGVLWQQSADSGVELGPRPKFIPPVSMPANYAELISNLESVFHVAEGHPELVPQYVPQPLSAPVPPVVPPAAPPTVAPVHSSHPAPAVANPTHAPTHTAPALSRGKRDVSRIVAGVADSVGDVLRPATNLLPGANLVVGAADAIECIASLEDCEGHSELVPCEFCDTEDPLV